MAATCTFLALWDYFYMCVKFNENTLNTLVTYRVEMKTLKLTTLPWVTAVALLILCTCKLKPRKPSLWCVIANPHAFEEI